MSTVMVEKVLCGAEEREAALRDGLDEAAAPRTAGRTADCRPVRWKRSDRVAERTLRLTADMVLGVLFVVLWPLN